MIKGHRLLVIWIVFGMFTPTKPQQCNSSLLDTVGDSQLTASSTFSSEYPVRAARLSGTGWSPDHSQVDPWIQVDFGYSKYIVAVVTKGLADASLSEWVKKYRVMYGQTTSAFAYVNTGSSNEFTANFDSNTAVVNPLPTSVTARYLRLYPTEYNKYRSLRFDVIGCQVTTTPIPTTTTTIPTTTTTIPTTTTTIPTTTTTIPTTTTTIPTTTTTIPTTTTTIPTTTTTIPTTTTTIPTTTTTIPTTTTTIPTTTTTIPTTTTTIPTTTTTTTTMATTTTVPTITTTASVTATSQPLLTSTTVETCFCNCPHTNWTLNPQELQTKIQEMVKELSVPKNTLSSFIRSKTSASDERPQAMYVGTVGIAILCIFVGLIVLPDVYSAFRFFCACVKDKMKTHK
ncbi:uncharacterized protein LOC111131735 [Crassostrea virginica]